MALLKYGNECTTFRRVRRLYTEMLVVTDEMKRKRRNWMLVALAMQSITYLSTNLPSYKSCIMKNKSSQRR